MKLASKFIDNFLHSSLGDLQGGKEGEHYHLTKAEWEKTPTKPHIKSPVNGAKNIHQVPLILGSDYYHPYNMPMYWKEIQIATDAEFENIVYELPELEKFSANTSFQVPLKSDETSYLEPGTTYYVRIQYKDRAGKCSEWSDTSTFTTMAGFPDSVFLAPEMIIPPNNGEARASDPILAMKRAKVAAGVAIFDKADWQIAANPDFNPVLYEALGTDNLTMHQAKDVILSSSVGADFYARGRQWPVGETDESKVPWSPAVHFGIRPDYEDPVFGVRKIFSKRYGVPFVFNIDPLGEIVSIPKKYWDNHLLYSALSEDNVQEIPVTDSLTSSMVFVPPCYMKYRVYDNDDGDMVIDTWYSLTPQTEDGWRLDMAFEGNEHGFYHGVCLPYKATGGYYACKYETAGSTLAGFANNVESELGKMQNLDNSWHVWTIYERRFLLDLMIAEYATFDSSKISSGYGSANSEGSFNWRVFRSLVLESVIFLTGIKKTIANNVINKIQVMTPNRGNWMPYDVSIPIGSNLYATDILRGEREELGFDIALLGIVSEVEPTSNQDTSIYGTKVNLSIPQQFIANYCATNSQDGIFGLSHYDNTSTSYSTTRYFRISKNI